MYQHVLGACEARRSSARTSASSAGPGHSAGSTAGRWKPRCPPCRSATGPPSAPRRSPSGSTIIAPATIRGRTRIPAPARHHLKLKVDGPVHETWTLGYLTDTIYLRDLWMHRIDAARAARQPADLTASHDGRIVADITAEWARRHGKPFLAELSGPARGSYASDPANPAAEHISLDAVEFCRTLAGLAHPTGPLTTIVPF